MALFKTKQFTVNAEKLNEGDPWPDGVKFDHNSQRMYVTTIQGEAVLISYGEWVITEPDGIHHYPCADDVFTRKYELA